MQIYVCVKHVPDTAATITVVGDTGYNDTACKFIINPYDEYAVEEAVQRVEKAGSGEVVVVTVGSEAAVSTMRSAMAMGAHRGILVKIQGQFLDSTLTSLALKAAIEQDGAGTPDIIFTGKESIDSEGMQTMFRLAAALDVPIATSVVAFAIDENKALVECELEAGVKQLLEMPLPCVIAAGKGLNKPKYPTFMDIRKAKKKEIKQIDLTSLPIEKPTASMQILELKPAIETLKEIADSSIDFVFIDADKPSYSLYFDEALRILRSGGLVFVDNVFWRNKIFKKPISNENAKAIAAFNRKVKNTDGIDKVMLSVRDGVYLIRKR